MPEHTMPATVGHFIPNDLRPHVGPREDKPASPPRGASSEEVAAFARQTLSKLLDQRLARDQEGSLLMSNHASIRQGSDVLATEMDRETVLLNLENGVYYSLNRVGTAIWEWLSKPQSLPSLHERMCVRFQVAAATAWRDLCALVGDLHREKLITVSCHG